MTRCTASALLGASNAAPSKHSIMPLHCAECQLIKVCSILLPAQAHLYDPPYICKTRQYVQQNTVQVFITCSSHLLLPRQPHPLPLPPAHPPPLPNIKPANKIPIPKPANPINLLHHHPHPHPLMRRALTPRQPQSTILMQCNKTLHDPTPLRLPQRNLLQIPAQARARKVRWAPWLRASDSLVFIPPRDREGDVAAGGRVAGGG